MFCATRLKQLGMVMLAVSALAVAGCASDSSDDDKKSGSGTTDSATGSSAASSVEGAMNTALNGAAGSEIELTAQSPIPQAVLSALSAQPGVGPIGRIGGGNEATVGPVTATLTFSEGPYACAAGGTVGATGAVSYTYSYDFTDSPYFYSDDFSTTDPLDLTLDACSDGVWTLDGDVTYEVGEVFDISSVDGLTWDFSYLYNDSFEANVTGTEEATSEEGTLEMTYSLSGELVGSYDSSANFTYTTYTWQFDLTINGESYSCTLTGADQDATCE